MQTPRILYPEETSLIRSSVNTTPVVIHKNIADGADELAQPIVLDAIRIEYVDGKSHIQIKTQERQALGSLLDLATGSEPRGIPAFGVDSCVVTERLGTKELVLNLEGGAKMDIEKILKTLLGIPLAAKLPDAFAVGLDEIKQRMGRG